jgi:hypothetical protein
MQDDETLPNFIKKKHPLKGKKKKQEVKTKVKANTFCVCYYLRIHHSQSSAFVVKIFIKQLQF